MSAGLSPRLRNIAEIFDLTKNVSNTRLACLSTLNSEEVEFLSKLWLKADLKRRQEIISQLVHLSEINLALDFSGVFVCSLSDPDETIRAQAVAGLIGEDNYLLIKPIVRALKEDASAKVRSAAAMALREFALQGELGNLPSYYCEKIYNSLLEVLGNKSELTEVKRRALEAISPFNLPRVKELIETTYHTGDNKLKASAIFAMGRNCDLAWLPILLAELANEEPEIRYEAASACGELGAEEAVPLLIKMAENEDQQVQEAAIKALGTIGNEKAKQILSKLVKNPQPRIRDAAQSALREIQNCEDPLSTRD